MIAFKFLANYNICNCSYYYHPGPSLLSGYMTVANIKKITSVRNYFKVQFSHFKQPFSKAKPTFCEF